ncbi:MAG: hypothetical protein ACRDO7_01320 [Nocardioidaceae bacterium]
MRRVAGAVLALLGLCVAVLGAALAIWVGTDNRASTGPHPMETDAAAVATAPDAITWSGATVTVVAEVPDDKPVFIGVANAVDVDDYLRDTRTLRVDGFSAPWTLDTSVDDGHRWLPATPVALDWWQAEAAGMGGARLEFELPDETISLAVLAIGDADLSGLTITASYEVRGGFVIGLGIVAVGVGMIVAGIVVFRGFAGRNVVDDDGYVYVYIDDDGNEVLVPIDELDDYDIVDVTGERR